MLHDICTTQSQLRVCLSEAQTCMARSLIEGMSDTALYAITSEIWRPPEEPAWLPSSWLCRSCRRVSSFTRFSKSSWFSFCFFLQARCTWGEKLQDCHSLWAIAATVAQPSSGPAGSLNTRCNEGTAALFVFELGGKDSHTTTVMMASSTVCDIHYAEQLGRAMWCSADAGVPSCLHMALQRQSEAEGPPMRHVTLGQSFCQHCIKQT